MVLDLGLGEGLADAVGVHGADVFVGDDEGSAVAAVVDEMGAEVLVDGGADVYGVAAGAEGDGDDSAGEVGGGLRHGLCSWVGVVLFGRLWFLILPTLKNLKFFLTQHS